MEKPKQRRPLRTFEDLPEHSESKFPPSITVQGEAMTIEEIMARYAQGVELPRRASDYIDAEFEDREGFVKPGLDLTEIVDRKKRSDSLEKELRDFVNKKEDLQ